MALMMGMAATNGRLARGLNGARFALRGGAEQTPAPSPEALLLEDVQYMSPRSRDFVRSSLRAWSELSEPERRVPSRL